jgi:pyruvate/2-oxoglutarate dehydrogenase complex dihydrolipoamide acyltransferase (E2) component
MIKIEVTGNSIPEVADKLLAIGASLRSAPTAFQPTEPVNSITSSNIDPVMPELREVAKAAPVDPTPAPKSAPVATATESQPTTEEPSSTPAPAASASELDFELDVAPVVLRAVGSKGKAFVQDVLSEFGTERASQLAVSLWPELIARLEAEMA